MHKNYSKVIVKKPKQEPNSVLEQVCHPQIGSLYIQGLHQAKPWDAGIGVN